VLTDFLMPGLTGAEVVEALQRRDPAVKVVMLTGSAMEGDVARVRDRGVTVLGKPVSLDRFSAVIAEVLAGAPSEPIDPAPRPAAAPLVAAGPPRPG
jgi:CheY-like chemotaxis protein